MADGVRACWGERKLLCIDKYFPFKLFAWSDARACVCVTPTIVFGAREEEGLSHRTNLTRQSRVRFPFFDSSCPRNFSTIDNRILSPLSPAHFTLRIDSLIHARQFVSVPVRMCVCHSDHIRFRTGFIGKRKAQNEKNEREIDCFEFPLCYTMFELCSLFSAAFSTDGDGDSFRFYSVPFSMSLDYCLLQCCSRTHSFVLLMMITMYSV